MDPDVSLETVAKTILPHDLREVWTFVGCTAVSLGHECESHPLKNSVCVSRSNFILLVGKASLHVCRNRQGLKSLSCYRS